MSRADAVIKRLDGALTRFAPPSRKVYKRVVSLTGGDDLIGRGNSTVYTDTLLKPQPYYSRLSKQTVGLEVPAEMIISEMGNASFVADEYVCILSPSAISEIELQNPGLVLILKDSLNRVETFRITDYEPIGMSAQSVMFIAYIRSTELPAQ